MRRGRTERVFVRKWDGLGARREPDEVIVEDAMEIRLDGALVTTTMRTPGHDFELAVGFCHTEGLLGGAPVTGVRYCATGSAAATGFNVVTVDTGGAAPVPEPRVSLTTASCGICGSAGLEQLRQRLDPLVEPVSFAHDVLAKVPDEVLGLQGLFAVTGGVHGAAVFDTSGTPLITREDVGRHNAVDKVVGRLALDGALPAAGLGLFVSGRASFEIVQKAWAAGFAALLAVGAPSSLAIATARSAGLLLAGFARQDRLNVYAPS
jgi:FdhD protein